MLFPVANLKESIIFVKDLVAIIPSTKTSSTE